MGFIMAQEFETKILEINSEEIEKKLLAVGAILHEDTVLMKRWVFDVKAHEAGKGKRIRLRQKGDKTTITYKERNGNEIGATNERETSVGNFDIMAEILQKLSRETMVYQENKRKTYLLNDIEFCIDSWPKIPTYLEIEGPTQEAVHKWLEIVWCIGKDEGDIGVIEIYEKYGFDLHTYKVLKFE